MGGSPNGHAPPHDFDLSTVIAYKRNSGASVVVLGEDEWRKGRRASLLGLGGPSGVAGTRWGGRRASLGLCGAGVGL